MKNSKLIYFGDVNAEYGGYFFDASNMKKHRYADVVRIVPCSDAGGPDNQFWIERLTVNLPPAEEMSGNGKGAEALRYIGMSCEQFNSLTPYARDCLTVDACLAYGQFDQDGSEHVQIGAWDEFTNADKTEWACNTRLRGNTSIKQYAYKVAKGQK